MRKSSTRMLLKSLHICAMPYVLAVVQQELHVGVHHLHVGHVGWREHLRPDQRRTQNHRQVVARHLVHLLQALHALQQRYQKGQALLVDHRQRPHQHQHLRGGRRRLLHQMLVKVEREQRNGQPIEKSLNEVSQGEMLIKIIDQLVLLIR